MPFQIIQKDITEIGTDAIVNPTDEWLSGSGGTDYAVHSAAGRQLDEACEQIEELQTSEIAVTDAYNLPCQYVFHTVGPIWKDGSRNEEALLRSCYLNALLKAKKMGLASIAFPLISSGTFGFPKDRVLRIAIDAVSDFLFTTDGEMQVFICILDRGAFVLSKEIALKEYLQRGKRFVYEDHALKMCQSEERAVSAPVSEDEDLFVLNEAPICSAPAPCAPQPKPITDEISDWIKKQDDSFAVMLLKLIDKKGMTDVECYKKANVTKGTFWKINNDPKYKPSKATVIAFAIALELDMDETTQLLKTVGFTLSNSNTFDMIIQFFIINQNYDIFEINAALFQYDQVCLGC